jgi:predicted dehydrogenase
MNPKANPFRLGIIGTGIVAGLHLDAVDALPDVSLVAVCDVDAARAAEAAKRFGATAWQDYREMLTTERLDGVIITSPHALHTEMALAAAKAGVAILLEKPMTTTLADADAIIAACARAGVVLAIGHVLRFDPTTQAAAAAIASGELGRPLAILQRRSSDYRAGTRPGWFFDPVMAGGGIAMNVGPHGLDKIQWLGGGPIVEVTGKAWKRGGLQIETDVIATARLASGVTASLTLTSAQIPYVDETLITCEAGSVRCSGSEGTLVSNGGPEKLVAAPVDLAVAFLAQLADFVDAVRTSRPPLVGGAYGRSVIAAILAIYESSATGKPVTINAPKTEQSND